MWRFLGGLDSYIDAGGTEPYFREECGKTHDKGTGKGISEAVDIKPVDEFSDTEEKEGIDKPDPDPEAQDDKRHGEQHQERLNKSAAKAQEEHRKEECLSIAVGDSREDQRGKQDAEGGKEPTLNECPKLHN